MASHHNALQRLADWVLAAGGRLSASLQLYQDETSGFSARTVQATEGAHRLVSCPAALIFSLANPPPSFPASFLGSPSVTVHAKACFHLCHHLLLQGDGPFWPYLSLLPQSFDTPLYFTPNELERLAGTNLGAGDVAMRKQLWTQEWEAGVRALTQIGGTPNIDRYTWDLYLRAATIYTSRSFPSKLVGVSIGSDDNDDFPVLIPLVDILNHKPNTKIVWEPTPTSFSLTSPEPLSVGSQVFNNYGPKGNEELLMGYGFVIHDNPADSLAMKFTISPRGPAADVWQRRRLSQNWSEVFHLTKSTQPDGKADPRLEDDWPAALVDLFRILVANEREIQLLYRGDVNLTPVSVRNELAVASGLKAAVSQKLAAIQKFDRSSTAPPSSHREKLADVYREGQEAIIVSKIANLEIFSEKYARDATLSVSGYLRGNDWLVQHLEENPVPVQEIEDDEGTSYEEVITREEMVLLIAVLREYSSRNRTSGSSDPAGFWATLFRNADEFTGAAEVTQESEEIYDILTDYCNLIVSPSGTPWIGREVTSSHVSWAWSMVREKSIDNGNDTLLTI